MAKSDLREWAVKGAEQRLVELADEARTIFAAFPELRGRGRGFDVSRGRAVAASLTPDVRPRKTMSAGARRKIARAQKKRWSAWRKKKEKAGS